MLAQLIVFATAALLAAPFQAVSLEEDLREAARQGDVARVAALLDRGVAVDAPTRYKSTALFFAADRGHFNVVRLLVERGANVNVEDTFYRNTVLGQALGGKHFEIARYLLAHGANDADRAITVAARAGDRLLLEAAIATNKVHAEALVTALAAARSRSDADMANLLSGVKPAPAPVIAIDAQTLRNYAGAYQNDALRQTAQVTIVDGVLSVKIGDEPLRALKPAAPASFAAAEGADFRISFTGRGGMIEQMVLARGGRTVNYRPASESEGRDLGPDGAVDAISTTPLPPAPRTAPKPWPAFRGANASGIADGQGAPADWNVTTGKNVIWKTAVPGFANSAPIIWGDRVFVTSAVSSAGNETFRIGLYGSTTPVDDLSQHVWRIYSLDRRTGKILWERVVYEGAPKTKRHTKASQANSTPVTDGQRVIAVFGSIGLMVCYDVEGNLLWKKDLGVMHSGWFYDPDYTWGHSSSPIIYKDMAVIQVDTYKGSYIAAFKVATGEEVWRTIREGEISTFATPTIYSGRTGDELVTNGTKMRSYDPLNGRLLWQLGPNSEIPIPTPIVSGDLIFLTAGYPPLRPIYVVRPGQRGDLSLPAGQEKSEAVTWSANHGGVYIPTPIVYDGYFYTTAENGRLTCYKASTGEIMYQVRIGGMGGSYAASPIAADGKLYFASEEGDIFVVRAGPKYELLAKNAMGEIIMANPGVSDGVMVIRTLKHVYGVGTK